MATSWEDLFKFNTELLNDDYNKGQALVIKTKAKSSDNVTEISTSYKQSVPDAKTGDIKAAFEGKFKSTQGIHAHEIVAKNDGSVSYELKSNISDLTKVKGLTSVLSGSGSSLGGVPAFKVGAEYSNASTKAKALANVRSLHTVVTLSHLYKTYLFGAYFNIDLKNQGIINNELGFVWNPASGAKFGIQHVAAENKPLDLGKFWFYFSHAASASNTIGSEFSYEWQSKKVDAKLAVSHKFNDATSGKFKIDQDANVDAVIKHQYNSTLTANFVSAFSLKSIVESNKTKKLPIGLTFDFKF